MILLDSKYIKVLLLNLMKHILSVLRNGDVTLCTFKGYCARVFESDLSDAISVT